MSLTQPTSDIAELKKNDEAVTFSNMNCDEIYLNIFHTRVTSSSQGPLIKCLPSRQGNAYNKQCQTILVENSKSEYLQVTIAAIKKGNTYNKFVYYCSKHQNENTSNNLDTFPRYVINDYQQESTRQNIKIGD